MRELVKGSTLHSRYQQGVEAGLFARLRDGAPREYDDVICLDLEWTSLDGSQHQAPPEGVKPQPQPD